MTHFTATAGATRTLCGQRVDKHTALPAHHAHHARGPICPSCARAAGLKPASTLKGAR